MILWPIHFLFQEFKGKSYLCGQGNEKQDGNLTAKGVYLSIFFWKQKTGNNLNVQVQGNG